MNDFECIDCIDIFSRSPDVEVVFDFNGVRKRPIVDGYRPIHVMTDSCSITSPYLTTGLHRYYGKIAVDPNESILGTITFLTPEAYPKCLWIGKRIPIMDPPTVEIGVATVVRVINPLLLAN